MSSGICRHQGALSGNFVLFILSNSTHHIKMLDKVDRQLLRFNSINAENYFLKIYLSYIHCVNQRHTVRADLSFVDMDTSDLPIINILRQASLEVARQLLGSFSNHPINIGSNYLRIPCDKYERFEVATQGECGGHIQFLWDQGN